MRNRRSRSGCISMMRQDLVSSFRIHCLISKTYYTQKGVLRTVFNDDLPTYVKHMEYLHQNNLGNFSLLRDIFPYRYKKYQKIVDDRNSKLRHCLHVRHQKESSVNIKEAERQAEKELRRHQKREVKSTPKPGSKRLNRFQRAVRRQRRKRARRKVRR
jgi:hypothetical protein